MAISLPNISPNLFTANAFPAGSIAPDPEDTTQDTTVAADTTTDAPEVAIPESGIVTPTEQQVKQEELLSTDAGQVAAVSPSQAVTAEAAQLAAPTQVESTGMEAATVETDQMEAVKGELSDRSLIKDPITGELRPASLAEAVVEEAPPEASIKFQLESLLTGMEGGEIPAWAKPAVASVESQLAQRGMGNSSVARDSLYNAIIQSAMPIATGDAAAAQQTFLANLDNKQQAVMFNAAQQANMDMANLDYHQRAQTMNAQAFLQLDFANMNNEQRSAEINMQARQQALLSNQSAENAARQFNAASETQTRQFMASLETQVADSNAARATAISQFNAGETNAMEKYNTQLDFQRETFNATNSLVIEQANVEWRRSVNTANTVADNEANQINAMNSFNLSSAALANIWQTERDKASYVWKSAENELDRANKITLVAMGASADAAIASAEAKSETGAALGAAAGYVVGGPLGGMIGGAIGGGLF